MWYQDPLFDFDASSVALSQENQNSSFLPSNSSENHLSFEVAMKELEDIVKRFEEQSLNLSEMLEAYERGMKLKNHCGLLLSRAQEKIEILNAKKD